ncbi:MAG: lysoplasmalogenase [Erysipelotrichaceae bacterium]|nr:lysoplasmalogenase [Erysipelotrichaceae bacterium]
MLNKIMLGLYAVFSAVHLYHSWKDDPKRKITKPFLLIFLILYYVFSMDRINVPLLMALFTSWLGDVLLIPKGDKWFVFGGISFIFCHLFFITVYYVRISFAGIPWLLVIPAAILYFSVGLKVVLAVKDNTPKAMLPLMYFYLLCNSTMNVFALMQLITLKNHGALTAFLGALLFYISDCILFLVRYHKNRNLIPKKHFAVMLAYLLGELMITVGIIMMGG